MSDIDVNYLARVCFRDLVSELAPTLSAESLESWRKSPTCFAIPEYVEGTVDASTLKAKLNEFKKLLSQKCSPEELEDVEVDLRRVLVDLAAEKRLTVSATERAIHINQRSVEFTSNETSNAGYQRIPVVLDSPTTNESNDLLYARCFYFRLTVEFPSLDASARSPEGTGIQVLIDSLDAVIVGPAGTYSEFNDSAQIAALFRILNSEPELSESPSMQFETESEILWIPNQLVVQARRNGRQDLTVSGRGEVFRISKVLFQACREFTQSRLSAEDFLAKCQNFLEKTNEHIEYSVLETIAFRNWSEETVRESEEFEN